MRAYLADRLADDPMATRPLLMIGWISEAAGNDALAEATRRDRRNFNVRLLNAQRHLVDGDVRPALDDMDALFTVARPEQRGSILDLLERIAATPEAQPAFLEAINAGHSWRQGLVARLLASSDDVEFLRDASAFSPEFQRRYVENLGQRGLFDLALFAWLTYDEIRPENLRWPVDPTFQQTDDPSPFNWVLPQRQAEFLEGGGLYIVHFGAEATTFAFQVTALGPGEYELHGDVAGSVGRATGDIRLVIRCMDSRERILTAPLRDLGNDETEGPVMTVGSDCRFQRIAVVGLPGEYPGVNRVTLKGLTVSPVAVAANAEVLQ